jgi:hypothetical protein
MRTKEREKGNNIHGIHYIHRSASADPTSCRSKTLKNKITTVTNWYRPFLVITPYMVQSNNYLHCSRYYKSWRDD